MGELIYLDEARRLRRRRPRQAAPFVFDFADPGSYEESRRVGPTAEFRPVSPPGAETGRIAARVALRAQEHGVGRPFALATLRLVHRWGRPVDDVETLAEAAQVAGLSLDEVLDAAYDPRRDHELEAAATG
jgi:2-hydroxychromene-2-carboxylate isomerase